MELGEEEEEEKFSLKKWICLGKIRFLSKASFSFSKIELS